MPVSPFLISARALCALTLGAAMLVPCALAPGGAAATPVTRGRHHVAHATADTGSGGVGNGGVGSAGVGSAGAGTGGAGIVGPAPAAPAASTPAHPTVPGNVAKILNGEAYAPADAPTAVKQAIWAGNAIRHTPYIYGGGHGSFTAAGYDCSGSVSYVLHAAGLITTPMDSVQFETWGRSGLGQWITVYTNDGHAFVQIAGIRLDTSAEQDPGAPSGSGPRWRPTMTSTAGYLARHPLGD